MNTLKLIASTLKEMLAAVENGMRRAGVMSATDALGAYRLLSEAIGAAQAIATIATLMAERIPNKRAQAIGLRACAEVEKLNRAALAMRRDLGAMITGSVAAPPHEPEPSPPVAPPETAQQPPDSSQDESRPAFHPREVNETEHATD